MRLFVALAALLCAAPSVPQELTPGYNTQTSFAIPPERYRGDGAAVVVFVSDIDAYCGPAPDGYTKLACAGERDGVPIIFMPNPAYRATQGDPYAILMSHELGHRNGWGGNHEL